jgi:hypothetical protein
MRVLAGGACLAIDLSDRTIHRKQRRPQGSLVVRPRKVQQAKGKVVLFGLGPNVRDVFSISGFDRIFSIQADSSRPSRRSAEPGL